ncbi:flavin reductase family protein [Pseudonocardia spinosispora]|uniref:flavin reductase family protein n=1 Tax=Pseudonocardia spinosispora TaxID=103441 RepID=UPI000415D9DD|nr:flavin reductase family protein [Pseudonocardia spinosispora]
MTGQDVNLARPELRTAYVAAMARTAAAVTVVTTDGLAGRFGQTVSAATSVTADPPTLLVCLYRTTSVAEAVRANGCFAVNVLGPDQRGVSDTFAGRGGAAGRYVFDEGWHTVRTGSPVYPSVPAAFDCVLSDSLVVGTHVVFVGRVIAVESTEAEGLTYRDRGYGRHIPEPN